MKKYQDESTRTKNITLTPQKNLHQSESSLSPRPRLRLKLPRSSAFSADRQPRMHSLRDFAVRIHKDPSRLNPKDGIGLNPVRKWKTSSQLSPSGPLNTKILKDLLLARAHIGKGSLSNDLSHFLIGRRRQGKTVVSIFDLNETVYRIREVLLFLENIQRIKGRILFVNSDIQYSQIIKKVAQATGHPYVNDRWITGTLTNWKEVSPSIALFKKFAARFETFIRQNKIYYPPYERAKRRYEGLVSEKKDSTRVQYQLIGDVNKRHYQKNRSRHHYPSYQPDVVIFTNPGRSLDALREAKISQIPTIGFVDSNLPFLVDYFIPGNNESIDFIYYICNLITIILKGKRKSIDR